jgi:hypothetical protein
MLKTLIPDFGESLKTCFLDLFIHCFTGQQAEKSPFPNLRESNQTKLHTNLNKEWAKGAKSGKN